MMDTKRENPLGGRISAPDGGAKPSWIEFGRQLRRLRISANLTQERLAEASGVATRSIGSIERGQSAPRAATVNLLIAALARGEVNGDSLRRLALNIRLAEVM